MLSAFFSGSETGLYRVSRTRLVLDGLSGSTAAAWNRLAVESSLDLCRHNFGRQQFGQLHHQLCDCAWHFERCLDPASSTELIGTILMTPIVFVFGELLPKYLFYHAPYQLITATRPLLLIGDDRLRTGLFGAGAIGPGFAASDGPNSVSIAIGDGAR